MFEIPLSGHLAEIAYIAGRAVAGCLTFRTEAGFESIDDCFVNAVVYGEWEPGPNVQAMPKAVIVPSMFTAKNESESEGNHTSSGTITILIYVKPNSEVTNESLKELWALNFFGNIISELFEQATGLNSEGDQFQGKTFFLTQIDLMGPTRTLIQERGPNGENDYFDAALMLTIGL